MSNVGLFAAGECAAGINGANRLGGNSLSDLASVWEARRREFAPESRSRIRPARLMPASDKTTRSALNHSSAISMSERRVQVQKICRK